jgi:hypothetical protein
VEKPFQADLGPLAGSKGATVKTFSGCEVPLPTDTEIATAAEWGRAMFTGSTLGIHDDS